MKTFETKPKFKFDARKNRKEEGWEEKERERK